MNRNQMLAGAIGIVVAAGGAGWFAGSQIASPAEEASRVRPPEASLITAAVDLRVLSSQIIARGDISYDDPISLSLQGSIGTPGELQVVTRVPELGTTLNEGSVALEVAGRPVIVLQGELPVFRDFRPGSNGLDVQQLEQALVRLGLLTSADTVWSDATSTAIERMYRNAGYVANGPDESQRGALEGARQRVTGASQAVSDAQKAINAGNGVSQADKLAAQAAVDDAIATLGVAQLQRDASNAAAVAVTASAQTALTSATGAATLAQARYTQALGGTHPDTLVAPTVEELAELLAERDATLAAKNDATAALTAAQYDQSIIAAQGTAAVNGATAQVSIQQAILAQLLSPGDTTALQRILADARRELGNAQKDLTSLLNTTGTWIPAGEIIFLDYAPVEITRVATSYGDVVSGVFMTVSGSEIALQVSLDERDAARVAIGDEVIVDDPSLEEPLVGTISLIPEIPNNGRIRVTVDLPTIPEFLIGANVRVTIPISSTGGEVLVVPAAALSVVANGDVVVEVENADAVGTTRFVVVETGLSADGVVQVTPLDGTLVKGDRVVVGQAAVVGGSPDPTPEPDAGE